MSVTIKQIDEAMASWAETFRQMDQRKKPSSWNEQQELKTEEQLNQDAEVQPRPWAPRSVGGGGEGWPKHKG